MLPAGRACRLVSVLSQALEDCAEQKKMLEDNLTLCRALLGDWKVQAPENPAPEGGPKNAQEHEPSPKELEELELLNRALEKALRVRKSTLQSPTEGVATAKGETLAVKKPATSTATTPQPPLSKESGPMPVPVAPVCKKAASSKKPSAHMLRAPYRTDPVRAPSSRSSRAPKAAGKNSAKGAAPHHVRKTVSAASVRQSECCAAAKLSGAPRPPRPQQQSAASFDGSANGQNLGAAIQQGADPENDCPGSPAETPVAQSRTAGEVPARSAMARTFTLQEKGSVLRLPLAYRKAYSRNGRLWEKCHLSQSSPTAAAAQNGFLERVQATFCSSTPALSPAELEEEVTVLRDAHSLLSQSLEAESTGHSAWEREYECLLTLEGLQDAAAQCLHKLQLLRTAAATQMALQPAACGSGAGPSPAGCMLLRGRRCGQMGVLARPLLFYSTGRELRDMAALKLRVAMLRQKINIQKVSRAELLSILESRRPGEPPPSLLYRAVYTQLCEGGSWPVLSGGFLKTEPVATEALAQQLQPPCLAGSRRGASQSPKTPVPLRPLYLWLEGLAPSGLKYQ
ncbi:tubulin epsilon and delta complex protein 2 isoform X2 [Pelodiscus sinensis]|uniref:tubulin epsilon and delta complex protein 2 isoform X2 n=1 Tax=Pelodiscus sinensis TaxID=13735 RepID=UPI003F6B197E